MTDLRKQHASMVATKAPANGRGTCDWDEYAEILHPDGTVYCCISKPKAAETKSVKTVYKQVKKKIIFNILLRRKYRLIIIKFLNIKNNYAIIRINNNNNNLKLIIISNFKTFK